VNHNGHYRQHNAGQPHWQGPPAHDHGRLFPRAQGAPYWLDLQPRQTFFGPSPPLPNTTNWGVAGGCHTNPLFCCVHGPGAHSNGAGVAPVGEGQAQVGEIDEAGGRKEQEASSGQQSVDHEYGSHGQTNQDYGTEYATTAHPLSSRETNASGPSNGRSNARPSTPPRHADYPAELGQSPATRRALRTAAALPLGRASTVESDDAGDSPAEASLPPAQASASDGGLGVRRTSSARRRAERRSSGGL
jgi:hypothetical protein